MRVLWGARVCWIQTPLNHRLTGLDLSAATARALSVVSRCGWAGHSRDDVIVGVSGGRCDYGLWRGGTRIELSVVSQG